MKVSELMNSNVVSLRPDDTVAHAATLLARHNIGALPVCAPDGRLRGMVTDRDIVLRCVASESQPEETAAREIMTRGEVEGVILRAPRGEGGFGYDPIFFLPERDASMAELSAEEKNEISHRARALSALREKLKNMIG